jgi:hypothetical protein
MKKLWTALCVALAAGQRCRPAQAHSTSRPRKTSSATAMAAAHEAAAKCLEGGKGEAVCMKELQAACKNLAIGKYCGMKHAH